MTLGRRILLFSLLALPILTIQSVQIQRPYAGHFASYQQVMASMARNIVRENFSDLLNPKVDLLINGKRSLHLNQYPFPSVIAAAGVKVFGGNFEFWGRFQSVLFNLGCLILMGLIAFAFWGEIQAWIVMIIYGFSPYTLIYGQGFFSEPMSLFFLLLSIFFIRKKTNFLSLLISAFCFSVAVTGRVHFVLLLLPMLLWIFTQNPTRKISQCLLFIAVSLWLPAVWYGYTYWKGMHTDHLLTNLFLQLGMRQVGDQHYLSDSAYYLQLLRIFMGTMLTPLMFPFFIFGFCFMKKLVQTIFLLAGILVGAALVILSPQKIMAHDFYLYGVFPFICLIAANGAFYFLQKYPKFKKPVFFGPLIFLYLSLSALFFRNSIFSHHEDLKSLNAAAKAVQNFSTPADIVIVAGNEPAGLVYYMDRPAVTLALQSVGRQLPGYLTNSRFTQVDLEDVKKLEAAMKDPVPWFEYLRQQGAAYLVTPTKKDIQGTPLLSYIESRFKQLSTEHDEFYLFALNP